MLWLKFGPSNLTDLKGDKLGALMACLKTAKSIGVLHQLSKKSSSAKEKKRSSVNKDANDDVKEKDSEVCKGTEGTFLWNGVVPISVLKQALVHQSDQVHI